MLVKSLSSKRMLSTQPNRSYTKQIHLLLFGAPGVGKGTFGKLIEKDFDFPTFSMGDYFRSIINDLNAN